MATSSLCVNMQNILNYHVGKFTSSKQACAEGVIFFLIGGDKSSPKFHKKRQENPRKARFICLLIFPHGVETVTASLL